MKTIDTWLSEYGQSHLNPTNKKLHWICVPAIYFSIIGLLWHLHPLAMLLALAMLHIFYLRLSLKLFTVMLLLTTICALAVMFSPLSTWHYVAIFVIAWIGQFVGHAVEGKKPSFFKDMQFLAVGPAWCADAWFRRWVKNW